MSARRFARSFPTSAAAWVFFMPPSVPLSSLPSVEADAKAGTGLSTALDNAHAVAVDALERTRDLVAQHGKAAAFQEKTRGIQDAGSTVAVILIHTMADFVSHGAARPVGT